VKRGFRLSRPADFKRVRRLGRTYTHPFLVLVVHTNDLARVRVAVAAGRSVGGAVQRNRAKRVLRAAIQPQLERIAPGHDLLVIAKSAVRDATSTQAHEVLAKLLNRAKLISLT
jgi:ribonuclease P protein component